MTPKNILFFLACCMFAFIPTIAAAATVFSHEIPKDAHKSVLNVITYDSEGNRLFSGYATMIDAEGNAVAPYALFKDAARAEVIDAKGKSYKVARILGASSAYDLVKFSIEGIKKPSFFEISETSVAAGEQLSLIRYTEGKKSKAVSLNVTKVEPYDKYNYLYITAKSEAQNVGCPLLNDSGHLVGFVQAATASDTASAYAIDARFCNELSINQTSILNADLHTILIPKALPAGRDAALTRLYMMNRNDSVAYVTALADFITLYPEEAEGHVMRGAFYANRMDYNRCTSDFNIALELSEKEDSKMKTDEVNNELSKLIYQKVIYSPKPEVEGWTLQRAAELAHTAYERNPLPFYLLQEGRCFFGMQAYDKAYNSFLQLCKTFGKNAETQWSAPARAEAWFFAARSLELSGGDSLKVIALLDSVITTLPQPYEAATAKYFLERAIRLERADRFRDAVMDYNEYERTIGPKNLSAQFYYIREQVELKAKMYQQAIDDMRTAQVLSPQDPAYRIEEAYIFLLAGEYEQAVACCEKLIPDLPDSPDCYKIAGIAYGQLKQKTKAVAALKKAVELGDKSAEALIEKYK